MQADFVGISHRIRVSAGKQRPVELLSEEEKLINVSSLADLRIGKGSIMPWLQRRKPEQRVGG